MFKDKDYTSVAKIMSSITNNVITLTAPTTRGLDSKELQKIYEAIYIEQKQHYNVRMFDNDYDKAMDYAISIADEEDVILVFGSFSFLATIKVYIEREM